MKKITLFLITLLFVAGACEENVPETEFTATYKASGEFWVNYVETDGTAHGYTILSISNTADNDPDSVWITDDDNFLEFQVKVGCTLDPVTYAAEAGADIVWGDDTSIRNGKLIERADGDSIYMEIEWASDPGNIYTTSGRRYKGFLDDDGNPSYYADYPQD